MKRDRGRRRPPPKTGAGCWVRHQRMDMKTMGTSMAAKTESTAARTSGLAGGGEAAQQQVADVEQPEQKIGGEAGVPGPPDAPGGAAPEHAGDEADAGVEDGDFGGGEGEGVGGEGFEGIAAAPVEDRRARRRS